MKHFYNILSNIVLVCMVAVDANSAETLKVNLKDSIRPVTHCASGSLYGMTETLPIDIQSMVLPLKPHVFCLPPAGTDANQHPFGDGFVVAERLKNTNAQVQITLPDLLPYWPYKWPGKEAWLAEVEKYINKKHDSGLQNIHSYVIWNEPDGTWDNNNGDLYTTVWKPTYELIRRLDPKTPIVGPCISYYHGTRMKNFLKFCKENDCLPDEICWHQWGSEGFAGAVEDVKKIEMELGIPDLPLCINEYCAGSDDSKKKYEGCPGYSVPFIAKFERYKVESATISWWFTDLAGRLGSLLTRSNERGGGWWVYKWYGDMEGYMANVTPPNDKSDHVDGFAAVDRKNNCASLVLGGNSVGDCDVVFQSLPDFLGGKVRVRIERVTWESKDTPVSSTTIVSETDMALDGTTLTVPVKIESNLYAYRIWMSPLDVKQLPFNDVAATIPGTIEAEDYDVAGQGFSYLDNDAENKGNKYREDGVDIVDAEDGYAIGYTEKGEWVEYTVNVTETANYAISANVSNSAEINGFQLYIDDKKVTSEYTIPQTCEDWSVYEEVPIDTVQITEGEHVIKLVVVGNYVNIDWLKFSKYDPTGIEQIASYDDILKLQNVSIFDLNGRQVYQNQLKNNTYYIAVTPENKEGIKFLKHK